MLFFDFLISLLILLVGSFLIESLAIPKPVKILHRPLSSVFVHISMVFSVFAIFILISQRIWFSTALSFVVLTILVLVNNTKFKLLREPFVHQDFEYFVDLISHPRLYIPFFGVYRAFFLTMLIVVIIYFWLTIEKSYSLYAGFSFCLIFLNAAIYCIACNFKPKIDFIPTGEMKKNGFFSLVGFYFYEHRKKNKLIKANTISEEVEEKLGTQDIFIVQSESFFDPRKIYSFIEPDVLENFDLIKDESNLFGELEVPVWGANTVRTEFSFLTGLKIEDLGVHQFNPYPLLASYKLKTAISQLKDKGYHTVCIHPYPASFYKRDKVLPNLGFEKFIDIEDFSLNNDKVGQYIGDIAIGKKLVEYLSTVDGRPVFVFMITMENHGPLNLQKLDATIGNKLYKEEKISEKKEIRDLSVYLQHLKNSDRLVLFLKKYMIERNKNCTLCWYGDHVPIMNDVYENFGYPQSNTEYFIWNNISGGTKSEINLSVDELLAKVLQVASSG